MFPLGELFVDWYNQFILLSNVVACSSHGLCYSHELAHTKEMNHGPAFWELLDQFTNGCALQLRKELRAFHTGIPQSNVCP